MIFEKKYICFSNANFTIDNCTQGNYNASAKFPIVLTNIIPKKKEKKKVNFFF